MIASEQTFKTEIAKKLPSCVYLIYGNDDGLKKTYIKKATSLIADCDDCFNYSRFAADCDLQQVYDACMQFPLMSERKCVILCDFDFEKCADSNFSKLLNLIEELPDTTVLFLWMDIFEFDEKKSSRFKKLCSAVEAKKGISVKLDHRTATDLVKALTSAAGKRGCKMENSVARYLIETCSADLNILRNEIEKLCAFANGQEITSEMIDKVCVRSVEASVYNISRELVARNIGNSIKMLDELLFLKVKPHAILSVLSNAFCEMYIAKCASEAGTAPATIASEFGYKGREFVLTRAQDNARRLSTNSLGLCLEELLKADRKLKSTSADGRVILEELMVKLVYIMSEGKSIDKN